MFQMALPLEETSRPTQPLFVETTVHVDLALGDRGVRQQLEQMLDQYDLWSSTYVLMEFRRTAMYALQVARRLANMVPEDREFFSWILRAIDRGYGGQPRLLSPRQRDRSRAAVIMIMERLDGIPDARSVAVGLLDATISLVDNLAMAGIEHFVDETDCDLVRPDRVQGRRWPLTCNALQAQCQQSIFLNRERSPMAAVLSECQADEEFDDTKMLETLETVLAANPIQATGQRRCWALGDLVVALEARSVGRLLTSNRRHFAPICKAIGLPLETYSPYAAS